MLCDSADLASAVQSLSCVPQARQTAAAPQDSTSQNNHSYMQKHMTPPRIIASSSVGETAQRRDRPAAGGATVACRCFVELCRIGAPSK